MAMLAATLFISPPMVIWAGIGAGIRNERETIFTGLENLHPWNGRDRREIVEPGFYDSRAGSRHSTVSLAVGRMLRATLGKSVGHEIRTIFREGARRASECRTSA